MDELKLEAGQPEELRTLGINELAIIVFQISEF